MSRIGSTSWSVAHARAHFSQLIEKTRTEGPQMVTRNGRPAAVLVSIEEWDQNSARKGTLAEFLMNSPLAGSGLELRRLDHPPRKVEL